METWSSRRGFLLAAVGSAVGIGNIWRFASVVGQNGGGAYLIPYVLAVVACGIPLMVLELAVGRRLRTSMVGAFRHVGARLEPLGWLVATVVFTVLSYYLVITGWTLAFFAGSAVGRPVEFASLTSGMIPVLTFVLSAIATGLVVSLGVRAGIERAASVLMPLALLVLLVLFVRAATLPGFGEGVRYLFQPDFSVLADPGILSAAVGQAFFSLSVGFGVLITFGAYLDRDTDIPHSAIVITLADLGVALLAGMVIFPMVFSFGLTPTAGAELAFTTLPAAFQQTFGGRLLEPAFFLLLFVAALTSAVAMLELNVAALEERTRLTRRQATVLLTALVILLGLPSALSYSALDLRVWGWRILDGLDETVGTMALPLTALLIALVFTRRLARADLDQEYGVGPGAPAWRRAIRPVVTYVIPLVLVGITLSRLALNIDPAGWHQLPGIAFIGSVWQLVLTVVILAALLANTLTVVRLIGRRERR
ncbi:MAG: sodium-dependent transporter [Chloroflexi bacterium]|nr:sodium-dependent transporter [Chloroflexota bacterium]